MEWSGLFNFVRWTKLYRLDIVPANTTFTPRMYGFSRTHRYCYKPSADQLTSRVFDYPSYGNLVKLQGLINPANNPNPWINGIQVTRDDGVKVQLGPGDYRVLLNVLCWSGDTTNPRGL